MSDEHRNIPNEVARIVRKYLPDAEIILYGSRARGDARPDSDWDFKVVVDSAVPENVDTQLKSELMNLTIEGGEFIWCSISQRSKWESDLSRASPFYRNVNREGVRI